MSHKLLLFLTLCVLCMQHISAQGVKISATPGNPDASAILELQSTQQGFLIPRMTLQQRNAIVNPATGLQIYNLTTNCMEMYFPGNWKAISCQCNTFPSAAFTAQPASPTINSPATFTATQSGLLYTWGFSGGSPASGTGQSATSQWSQPGTYTVTLNVTDPFGCTASSSSQVVVNSCPPGTPNASFTYFPNTVSTVSPTTFSPATISGATYQWTFQGGNPASSTQQNPSVQWATPGTYTVSLTVTSISNGCSNTTTQSITVTNCATGGSQSFSYTGGIQTFTVPNNVCLVTVSANGAGGGTGGQALGGSGGRIVGAVSVSPGQQYQVIVGGAGGIYNGRAGAGGGGFSGLLNQNGNHVISAGGGGGAAGDDGCTGVIGNGGNGGGSPGASGSCGNGGAAGVPGQTPTVGNGGSGSVPGSNGTPGGGGNGGQTTADFGCGGGGGSYGLGSGQALTGSCTYTSGAGGFGGGGSGGTGGCGGTIERLSAGGGGGGGFNAGSGGSSTPGCVTCGGGGGGGGANYAINGVNVSQNVVGGGASPGQNGSVTITW